jgi:hypothetical protein
MWQRQVVLGLLLGPEQLPLKEQVLLRLWVQQPVLGPLLVLS